MTCGPQNDFGTNQQLLRSFILTASLFNCGLGFWAISATAVKPSRDYTKADLTGKKGPEGWAAAAPRLSGHLSTRARGPRNSPRAEISELRCPSWSSPAVNFGQTIPNTPHRA